jgi:hypothetical protein
MEEYKEILLHGRIRAKGKGDSQCAVCQVDDSQLHILCVCNRPSLCHLRSEAFQSMMELLTSWKQVFPLSPMESEMWQRYFSQI